MASSSWYYKRKCQADSLLTPTIVTTDLEKQKHTSYTVVPVYDISQVILKQNSSDLLKKENLPNNRIEQVLKEQYHFCILEDFEEVYVGRNRMIKSKYKEELHQIAISYPYHFCSIPFNNFYSNKK